MNDVTNMSKKELVTKICELLNSHGLGDSDVFGRKEPFSPSSEFARGLTYMPRDNLVKIAQCPIGDWSSFKSVYDAWGRAGALRFRPYMVHKHDNPSLVIRHNRYLHMFRGYHFQASGTIDGIGDYGSGSYRADFIAKPSYGGDLLRNGVIAYMLWWAALIDVGFKFDNFVELFRTDRGVIEEFLKTSIGYWSNTVNYSWSDIDEFVEIGRGNIDIYDRKMYQLQKDNGKVSAYMAIGKETVQVETADNNLVTIRIPELCLGTKYNLFDEDDMDSYNSEVEILENNHFREMLLVMATKLAGIELNFMGHYFLWSKPVAMRPINVPGVIIVKDLNQVYNAVPDEF